MIMMMIYRIYDNNKNKKCTSQGLFDFGPPGTSRGIADGYVLFLAPLPVGKHRIEFSVTDHLAGPTSELIKRDGTYTVFIK
jgi:hypothetical protein